MNIGQKSKNLEAIAILIGTIIGAGIFALPYAVMKSGFIVGLGYFIFCGTVTLIMHLIYGEIVLRTKGTQRIVGYGGFYLGKSGKALLLTSALVGMLFSRVVYLILASGFLAAVFGNIGNNLVYVLISWSILSLGIILDWKKLAFLELLVIVLLLMTVVIITLSSFSYFKLENIPLLNLKNFFLPWGIIFFAVGGASAIPELREILGDKTKNIKKIIIIGTLIPIIFYIIFTIGIIGATGLKTTPDAIGALKTIVSHNIIDLAAVLGLLCVATSYLSMGIVLKKIFIYDLKVNRILSSAFVCLMPLLLYLLSFNNFIKIISFLGLWLGAVEGMLLLAMHRRAKIAGDRQPEYSLRLPSIVYWIIGTIFIVGPILSIIFVKY